MVKPKLGGVKLVKKRAASAPVKKETKVPSKKKAIVSNAKTTPKATAVKSKKLTIKAGKDDARKIQIIENITKRAPQAEIPKVEPKTFFVSRVRVAVMRPFALPIDHGMVASNVARYAGTVFVVLGAFFTLYNLNTAFTQVDHALPLVAQTTSTCISGTDCNYTTTTSGSIDTTPDADIRVESAHEVLTSTVPVNVTVPRASRVDLVARNKQTGTVTQIGSLFKVSDLAWRTYWQTTSFDDGEYTLKAVVTNEFGTYTEEDSRIYSIQNHPIDTTTTAGTEPTGGVTEVPSVPTTQTSSEPIASTTTAPSTITASTTVVTQTLAPVSVELSMSEPLNGIVRVRAGVEGAGSVRVYAKKVDSTTSMLLGYATLREAGKWEYNWDTTKLGDGEYDLKVQAIFINGTSNARTLSALTIQNTGSETETVLVEDVVDTEEESALAPTITLSLTKSNPLSGTLDVYINATGLTFVELYVLPEKSLTPRFVGVAERQSDTAWRYRFNTALLPNGYYELYTKARHQYGDSESKRTAIRIENKLIVETTTTNTEYLEKLEQTGTEAGEFLAPLRMTDEMSDSEPSYVPPPSPYRVIIDEFSEDESEATIEVIEALKRDLQRIMEAYSKALREGNTEAVRELQNELEQVRERALNDLPIGEDQADLVTRVNEHLGTIIKDLRERIERGEALIKDRIGEAITKDSDLDGVSDYDEVNLYKTNPFAADTDQDGFNDGIEILKGYDPNNEEREVNVQYESPREQGVVREDLLTVDHVTTIESDTNKRAPKAHMGGRALPNSFVTLYIFSTPIVVTVKAGTDGNWSYIFDKELENGEHEVYVGITDNAGRIVAKSNPLSFVKTAEAFAPVDADEGVTVESTSAEPTLMSATIFLIFGSLAVVSLGLVLILLGLHVRSKETLLQPA